ncbi:hypothetical protein GCM10009689_10660 [Brevibacterium antiquum]|uniref:transposase n=1 Tax=Brevibacterium antiquum TaxID=234835 RepID=UPI0018DF20B9|nr:transposase [Brevibacterium antiquum]
MPVKYTDELKTRAVELVIHAQADPSTASGAITRLANELGLSKETLRVWVREHKDYAGVACQGRVDDGSGSEIQGR